MNPYLESHVWELLPPTLFQNLSCQISKSEINFCYIFLGDHFCNSIKHFSFSNFLHKKLLGQNPAQLNLDQALNQIWTKPTLGN